MHPSSVHLGRKDTKKVSGGAASSSQKDGKGVFNFNFKWLSSWIRPSNIPADQYKSLLQKKSDQPHHARRLVDKTRKNEDTNIGLGFESGEEMQDVVFDKTREGILSSGISANPSLDEAISLASGELLSVDQKKELQVNAWRLQKGEDIFRRLDRVTWIDSIKFSRLLGFSRKGSPRGNQDAVDRFLKAAGSLDFREKSFDKYFFEEDFRVVVVMDANGTFRLGYSTQNPSDPQKVGLAEKDRNRLTLLVFQAHIVEKYGPLAAEILWRPGSELSAMCEAGSALTPTKLWETLGEAKEMQLQGEIVEQRWGSGDVPSARRKTWSSSEDARTVIKFFHEKMSSHGAWGRIVYNKVEKSELGRDSRKVAKRIENKRTILAFMDFLEAKGIDHRVCATIWREDFLPTFREGIFDPSASKLQDIYEKALALNEQAALEFRFKLSSREADEAFQKVTKRALGSVLSQDWAAEVSRYTSRWKSLINKIWTEEKTVIGKTPAEIIAHRKFTKRLIKYLILQYGKEATEEIWRTKLRNAYILGTQLGSAEIISILNTAQEKSQGRQKAAEAAIRIYSEVYLRNSEANRQELGLDGANLAKLRRSFEARAAVYYAEKIKTQHARNPLMPAELEDIARRCYTQVLADILGVGLARDKKDELADELYIRLCEKLAENKLAKEEWRSALLITSKGEDGESKVTVRQGEIDRNGLISLDWRDVLVKNVMDDLEWTAQRFCEDTYSYLGTTSDWTDLRDNANITARFESGGSSVRSRQQQIAGMTSIPQNFPLNELGRILAESKSNPSDTLGEITDFGHIFRNAGNDIKYIYTISQVGLEEWVKIYNLSDPEIRAHFREMHDHFYITSEPQTIGMVLGVLGLALEVVNLRKAIQANKAKENDIEVAMAEYRTAMMLLKVLEHLRDYGHDIQLPPGIKRPQINQEQLDQCIELLEEDVKQKRNELDAAVLLNPVDWSCNWRSPWAATSSVVGITASTLFTLGSDPTWHSLFNYGFGMLFWGNFLLDASGFVSAGLNGYNTYRSYQRYSESKAARQRSEAATNAYFEAFNQLSEEKKEADFIATAHKAYREHKAEQSWFGNPELKPRRLITEEFRNDFNKAVKRAQNEGQHGFNTGMGVLRTAASLACVASATTMMFGKFGLFAGAGIGTVLFPGVGTIVGTVLGGVVSATIGLFIGISTYGFYKIYCYISKKISQNKTRAWQEAFVHHEGPKWEMMMQANLLPEQAEQLALHKLMRRDLDLALKMMALGLKKEYEAKHMVGKGRVLKTSNDFEDERLMDQEGKGSLEEEVHLEKLDGPKTPIMDMLLKYYLPYSEEDASKDWKKLVKNISWRDFVEELGSSKNPSLIESQLRARLVPV